MRGVVPERMPGKFTSPANGGFNEKPGHVQQSIAAFKMGILRMFSSGNKQDSAPGTPYDQLPYTYYADKLLPKSILPWKKYWGMNHNDAVKVLAEAMKGTDKTLLRLFELKSKKVKEVKEHNSKIIPEPRHENYAYAVFGTISLHRDAVTSRVFSHEAPHVFDWIMSGKFNPKHASSISSTVKNEYKQKLNLYNAAKKNGEDPLQHAMEPYAMKNVSEFAAIVIQGLLVPSDDDGLRRYTVEKASETAKYYDAHYQALKNYLDKDPANSNLSIDLNVIRKDAKFILERQTEISVRTATLQKGEGRKTGEPQIDPDVITSVSPQSPQAPLTPLRKGQGRADTGHSTGNAILADHFERHAAVLVDLGRYEEALKESDAALALHGPPPVLQARIQKNRVRAFVGLKEYGKALEAADAALALDVLPRVARAGIQNDRARAFVGLEEYDKALEACDAASETSRRLRLRARTRVLTETEAHRALALARDGSAQVPHASRASRSLTAGR
jgi:tetratricopeptide (TPR) repeat protein